MKRILTAGLMILLLVTIVNCAIAEQKDKDDESVVTYKKSQSLFYLRGKEEKALNEISDLIRNDSSDPVLFNVRGSIYYEKNDFVNAIEDYNRWIELRPADPDAYIARGDAYVAQGRIEKAIEDFTKATKVEPKHKLAKMKLEWAKNKINSQQPNKK